jgi:hypothetical protein
VQIPDYHAFIVSISLGAYDPSGEPLYWTCQDGGTLCWICINEEKARIEEAFRDRTPDDDQWLVVECYADEGLYEAYCCDNCGRAIVPGYDTAPEPEPATKEPETLSEFREAYRVVRMHAPTLDGMVPAFRVAPNRWCPVLEKLDGACHECPHAKGVDLSEMDGAIFSYATYDGFCDTKDKPDTFMVYLTGSNDERRKMEQEDDAKQAMSTFHQFKFDARAGNFKRVEVVRTDGVVCADWKFSEEGD